MSVMMVLLTIVQTGDSWSEAAMAMAALATVVFSAAAVVISTLGYGSARTQQDKEMDCKCEVDASPDTIHSHVLE